jgi:hypothetical protein
LVAYGKRLIAGGVRLTAHFALVFALVQDADSTGAAMFGQGAFATLLKREGTVEARALALGLAGASPKAVDADPLNGVALLVVRAVVVDRAIDLRDGDAGTVVA